MLSGEAAQPPPGQMEEADLRGEIIRDLHLSRPTISTCVSLLLQLFSPSVLPDQEPLTAVIYPTSRNVLDIHHWES